MTRQTPDNFHQRLERLARRPLELTWTRNTSHYLSFASAGRGRTLRVRLHRAFLYAPDRVVRAIGHWLAGRVGECPAAVRRFIDEPPASVRRLVRIGSERLRPKGNCYDLERILARVNARHLSGRARARITWGRRIRQKAVYARTLGAYYDSEKLIVMNPVLDQWAVPSWFLAYTVYHEALHAVQPKGEPAHGPWFQEALARHRRHRQAQRWEREHVALLTGHRRGAADDLRALTRGPWREHLDV